MKCSSFKQIRHTLATFGFISLLLGSLFTPVLAHAVSSADWQAGRIIDDSIFTDTSNMSVAQIQSFLNNQVPTCDTNGTQSAADWGYPNMTHAQFATQVKGWPGPPYVCLKDYYEVPKTSPGPAVPANNYSGSIPTGAVSAAQMIYNAAQQNHISPKVLLIKIRSESAGPLTNDTWPLQSQYTYAMGAHCPDSGPNHSANCDPNYGGFSIQISEAGALLRYYLDNMNQPWWPYKKPGTNAILYNPDPSCGSSAVGISTMATAALYTYTPYQPNDAALAAGYGTATCGAYGNRNFWLYYNEWFGNTRSYFGPGPSYTSRYAQGQCTIPSFDPSLIGRLYNPDTQDFFYTTSRAESCGAVSYGYIWDGVTMKAATGPDAIPVYRIANYERHIFTTSASVRDDAIANNGYHDEGVAFYVYSSNAADRTPVYGLQSGNTFFFTSAGKEAEYYVNNYGYSTYGVLFYTPALDDGNYTVARLVRNNQRIYTPNQVEIANAQQYGFKPEGSVGINDVMPNSGNLPVYRLRTPSGIYFYTTSRQQRDIAILYYNCTAEGIPFYSLAYSSTPVYGANNPYNGFWIFASNPQEYNDATRYYAYNGVGISWYSY